MKGTDIADQPLIGSENTDLMKKRVEKLVSMLCGFAKHTFFYRHMLRVLEGECLDKKKDAGLEVHKTFKSELCSWIIHIERKAGEKPRLAVMCVTRMHGDDWTTGFSSLDNPNWYSDDISTVYKHRGDLVDAMLEAFPDIAEKWCTILGNANVKM